MNYLPLTILFLILGGQAHAQAQGQERTREVRYLLGLQAKGFMGLGHYEDASDISRPNELSGASLEVLFELEHRRTQLGLSAGAYFLDNPVWASVAVRLCQDLFPRRTANVGIAIGWLSGDAALAGYKRVTDGAYALLSFGPNWRPGGERLVIRPQLFFSGALTTGYSNPRHVLGPSVEESRGVGLTMVGLQLAASLRL